MNNLPLIQSEDFFLRRGQKVLGHTSLLTLESGGVYYVTGPLASGKTTFLETIIGVLPFIGGSLSFPLLESFKTPYQYISDLIAYVPQKASLPAGYVPDLYYQRRYNAAEQDDIPLVIEILRKASGNIEWVSNVLTLMKLNEMAQQPFIQLSNGQTRRLLIALGLLKQPKLLVLDNPFIGLDIFARAELLVTLQSVSDAGINIIISGDSNHLPDFAQKVIYLDGKGRIDVYATSGFKKNIIVNQKVNSNIENIKSDQNPKSTAFYFCNLKNVTVSYGNKKVLEHLNWEVASGEHWLIQGPNGSGKSTLLGLLCGDHPQAYANEIYLFGQRRGYGESIWDIKKRIGYFSPELLRYYDQNITCMQAVGSGFNDFIGLIKPLTFYEKQQVLQLMRDIGIEYLAEQSFLRISDGEQRLVLLARAFIKNPPVLILDEPLQGLDENWLEFLKSWIQKFSRGKTLLYVSHENHEIPEGINKVFKLG